MSKFNQITAMILYVICLVLVLFNWISYLFVEGQEYRIYHSLFFLGFALLMASMMNRYIIIEAINESKKN